MHKREDFHNTREQVKESAAQAVLIADELELTPEDRAVLLPQICSQLSSKQIFYEQAAPLAGLDISHLRARR